MNWPWKRANQALTLEQYVDQLNHFTYNGLGYGLGAGTSYSTTPQEEIDRRFAGYVRGAYKANGIIFACILVRMLLFSEARFQFRKMVNGRPGDLFGTKALAKLETPWPGATTGDLLTRMEQDASLAGNFFALDRGARGVRRLRPDWMTLLLGSNESEAEAIRWDPDAEIVAYAYTPGGPASGREPKVYLPELVCHYAPIPDPEAQFRGMSWLEPIVTEIMADKAATQHKLKFFENAATPNIGVEFDPNVVKDVAEFEKWVEAIESKSKGVANAYRTLYLGAGAKPTVLGTNLRQIDFKVTQGAGETRIAAAAGVPPQVVGLSEGLQGSSLNEGNYTAARRRLADGTMRPLWRNAAGSLARIITVPGGAELWYDDRDVAFLQEDRKDAAEIQNQEAQTIRHLSDGGFKPESVVQAVLNDDWSQLEHTGLPSVQVQAPPTRNGSGSPSDNVQAVEAATTQEG